MEQLLQRLADQKIHNQIRQVIGHIHIQHTNNVGALYRCADARLLQETLLEIEFFTQFGMQKL